MNLSKRLLSSAGVIAAAALVGGLVNGAPYRFGAAGPAAQPASPESSPGARPRASAPAPDTLRSSEISAAGAKGTGDVLAQVQASEAAWLAEPADRGWAPGARQQIVDVLDDANLSGTSLRDVACRTTLCRMEVKHDDARSRADFAMHVATALAPFMAEGVVGARPNDGASSASIVYLARKGHTLPRGSEGE